jgi:hypothetical protein
MLTVRFFPLLLPGLFIFYAVPLEAGERMVARSQDGESFGLGIRLSMMRTQTLSPRRNAGYFAS